MLRLGTLLRLVLAALMIPLMLLGASAAEAQPHAKAVSDQGSAAADPPPGTPGPFKIVNQWSGMCLDYGNDGSYVYQGVCNATDRGQRWGWWNGGWLINLSNNQCVTDGEAYPLQVVPCLDWAPQHFRHQNFAIRNEESGYCAEPSTSAAGSRVSTVQCRTTDHQGWNVTYW